MARLFNLSRSTLLYYDRIKLLRPSVRGSNRYRYYNENDVKLLQRICCLREVGISLAKIKSVTHTREVHFVQILNQRLMDLNQEIQQLRNHQRMIVKLLGDNNLMRSTRSMNKEIWVNMLRAAGLNDEGMRKWHHQFEMNSPDAHQDFLESIGIKAAEIRKIREWSR